MGQENPLTSIARWSVIFPVLALTSEISFFRAQTQGCTAKVFNTQNEYTMGMLEELP